MDLKTIKADSEGAEALREFAEAMPLAISRIVESTDELFKTYQSVAETCGPHSEDFLGFLYVLKSKVDDATNTLSILPAMLNKTADEIDFFVRMQQQLSEK